MSQLMKSKGLGNIPDTPDVQDFSYQDVAEALPKPLVNSLNKAETAPKESDNRKYSSPISDQGIQGSCGGQAIISMVEALTKFVYGKYYDMSPAYAYWNSRQMMGEQYTKIDSGSMNRLNVKGVVKRGCIPNKEFPYNEKVVNLAPTYTQMIDALDYQALKYFRVDSEPKYDMALVEKMKLILAQGYNIFTGFTAYDFIYDVNRRNPVLKYPSKTDRNIGGHAVLIVGHSNDINTNVGQGAFLVQNSWGTDYGDRGFFWIPYEYFSNGIGVDSWVITSIEFLDEGVFR